MAYKKNSLKQKKELYYIFLIMVVGVILLLSFGPNGYLELKKVKLKYQAKRESVGALERSNAELLRKIEALRSDREAIERYAREKGYGRDNEIIEQLPADPGKNPEP